MNRQSLSFLSLVVGVLITAVVLGFTFCSGIVFMSRNDWYNFQVWTHFGWPVLIFGFLFFCALNHLLRWQHLLLATLLLVAIANHLLSERELLTLAYRWKIPEFEPSTSGILLGIGSFTFTIMLVPGMLGVALGSWADRQAPKKRRRAVLAAILLIAASPGIRWIGTSLYTQYSGMRAGTMGTSQLRVNARDLQFTEVVPTLDSKITEGRNLIWCTTFQLAWNELCALAGEDIHMEREHPSVELLNKSATDKGQLDPATYLAIATDNKDKLSEAILNKFEGKAQIPTSLPTGDLMLYSHLVANLPFEWAFERHKFPFSFKGTPVESFGIVQYLESDSNERRMAEQVEVFHIEKEPGFVLELKTRNPKHHLYLALIPPQPTLGETVTDALKRIKHGQSQPFPEGAHLIIPIIDFDLTRDYPELTGRPLNVPKFNGLPIASAIQKIRFKLDERGAELESSAVMTFLSLPDNFEFNQGFLVILQYADTPYFAAWIDHPELLIKK